MTTSSTKPVPEAALIVHPALLRRKSLAHLLRRQGFVRVHEADDAVEAASVASEERVDVIFTLWNAGRLSGPELFRSLRARGRKAAPAIVVLDEGLPQATVVAAVKAGAVGRLALPATGEALARVLEHLAGAEAAEQAAPPHTHRD